MYLRTTQRRNRDGSVVRYVQLARNRRVDGVTQAEVLLNLGGEDRLDRDGLARLVASINRYLGQPAVLPADAAELVGDGLTVTGSRPMGTVHLLDALWRQLGAWTPRWGSCSARAQAVAHRRRTRPVRSGRRPGHRLDVEAVRRGMGRPRRRDPRGGGR
jgi:hypothetical protein